VENILNIVLDIHSHTVACQHGYSTVQEIARQASDIGLEMFAVTEHGPRLLAANNEYFFRNIRVIPRKIYGVKILRGVEANILDDEGNIDLTERALKRLDIVIASLHESVFSPRDIHTNTKALINAIKNPYVDIIGHPGNPRFPIDIERVIQAALDNNKLLEINNHSFRARKGSFKNCIKLAKGIKDAGGMVALGSDAHISFHIGIFDKAMELIEEAGLGEENVINTSVEKLLDYLKTRGKEIEF
jgi:putative hydrolase